MHLKLVPHIKNTFPLNAILIKGSDVEAWLLEITEMQLKLSEFDAYPIPGEQANSLYGCLLHLHKSSSVSQSSKSIFCQVIQHTLIIPAYSKLFPQLNIEEMQGLLKHKLHFMHPTLGLIELEEKINWLSLVNQTKETPLSYFSPQPGFIAPGTIKSYQIHKVPPEEVLKTMEKDLFPKQEKFKEKPLNAIEKVKLASLKALFRKNKDKDGNLAGEGTEKSAFAKKLEKLFGKGRSKFLDRLQLDYEELEHRNQKEVEKLLDMFKRNPEEALKYAMPLDPENTGRGGDKELYSLSRLWSNFSLSSSPQYGGGGVVLGGDYFSKLNAQYHKTGEELIKNGQYEKAAFVYLKLLKNPLLAAETLANGKLYTEAAALYIKQLSNKQKAAECYEKAKMTEHAIELYIELNEHEKVGDLYSILGKRKEAFTHYNKVIDIYKQHAQYVKAALLYRNKMNDTNSAQDLLLEGWKTDIDSFNCLNNYLANIDDLKDLKKEIQRLYHYDVEDKNKEKFLTILSVEFKKSAELAELATGIAHEIIADRVKANPTIISELKNFNKTDKHLIKDIMRFKIAKKNNIRK